MIEVLRSKAPEKSENLGLGVWGVGVYRATSP